MDKGEKDLVKVLCHASVLFFPFLLPFLVFLFKGDEDKSVKYHALQAAAYHLSFTLVWFLLIGGGMVLSFFTFGLILFLVVPLGFLVFFGFILYGLYAAYQVYQGEDFSYVLIGDLVKKYA